MRPFLLVLSSPSGGGKTTIARALLEGRDDLGYSVSATTRALRPGERDGWDYHFLARDEFERRVEAGEFVEWAEYGGQYYGTLKQEVEQLLSQQRVAVLDIDVQGARQIRAAIPDSVHVFILPPSGAVLAARLKARNTESPERIRQRLHRAAEELGAVPEYDYAVVNADLVAAVSHVAAIVEAETRRVSRETALAGMLDQLRADVLAEARAIK